MASQGEEHKTEDHEGVPQAAESDAGASPSAVVSLALNDCGNDPGSEGGTKVAKTETKAKKGSKKKAASATKGIQTSVHLLDSSVFRDRTFDLASAREEAGVVCVEALQDLDVALEEWPILLVRQLRLRDTLIDKLDASIGELVEKGQSLEQDLDYLKLKILELQQEVKHRARELQRHSNTRKEEAAIQTTEEDLAEAWRRWYYSSWGDYYSESDPASSSYWPGHYTQQTTVPSSSSQPVTDVNRSDTQQTTEPNSINTQQNTECHRSTENSHQHRRQEKTKETSKEAQGQDNSEEVKSVRGRRERGTHHHSSGASDRASRSPEARKSRRRKHEGKKKRDKHKEGKRRKDRHKKRNSSPSEELCTDQEGAQGEQEGGEGGVKTEVKNEQGEGDTHTTCASEARAMQHPEATNTTVHAAAAQEPRADHISGAQESEEGKGANLGWDSSQSITQQVAEVAAQAVVESGYVFQEELGQYYDYSTGYYYNAENGLYYDTRSGTYFYYDHATQTYQFYSQASPTTATMRKKRRARKGTHDTDKKKLSKKNEEDPQEKEDGECTESEEEGEEEGGQEEESEEEGEGEEEEKKGEDLTPADEQGMAADIPPSLRLMVVEGGDRVPVGGLHLVTVDGGTVGREATNSVHLPDLNISKVHAEIEYRSGGAEDHHYYLRDLGSNNGTFVNSVRLSDARQASQQVEVGHGWELQFGSIKLKCHLHPGTLTCNECEPGLVLSSLPSATPQQGEAVTSFKNAKSREKARRKQLKAMQKKYRLTPWDCPPSAAPPTGYTDRALLRQAQKGSDNPYEKTEVASTEVPLRETNRGFTLLQKMGWSQGQGLGKANTGITEPVQPVSVVGQGGLGSTEAAPTAPPDPQVMQRRKRLQITQARYKQASSSN